MNQEQLIRIMAPYWSANPIKVNGVLQKRDPLYVLLEKYSQERMRQLDKYMRHRGRKRKSDSYHTVRGYKQELKGANRKVKPDENNDALIEFGILMQEITDLVARSRRANRWVHRFNRPPKGVRKHIRNQKGVQRRGRSK